MILNILYDLLTLKKLMHNLVPLLFDLDAFCVNFCFFLFQFIILIVKYQIRSD
jgi:hypothetical protein